ncbi:MAG TPA: HAMP domain-containing sensor histidine kinase [Bacteroidota bacterium]|nr:HAMP domain-containing sensor histidine kinase [Bacteroidota bacterium]
MRLTLYWKLLLGFGLVVFVLTAANIYVLFQLVTVSSATRSTITRDVMSVDLTKQLRTVLSDEERYAQKYLVTRDSTYFSLFSDQQRLALGILASLAQSAKDSTEVERVQATSLRHAWYVTAVLATYKADPPTVEVVNRQEAMMDTLDVVYRDLEEMVRARQRAVQATVVAAEDSAETAAEVSLLLTVGALFLAGGIALALTQSITVPLRALMRATDEVAQGTFTKVQMKMRGEIGRLADAFNHMGARLRHAQQARVEMMHHISHEIRMPLQTMHSAYYLLSEGEAGPVTEDQKRLLSTMRENIDKITRFSNQFLDLARIEAGMMEFELLPTDLHHILEQTIDDARIIATRKGVDISFEATPVPAAKANPDRCNQVFSNLLNNAVKYTDPGGKIFVSLCATDTIVRCAVKDTGVGISPEEIKNIFQKFYRASNAGRRGGTGIGLALVQALVHGMGGQVTVESAPGEGSTFVVEFQISPS